LGLKVLGFVNAGTLGEIRPNTLFKGVSHGGSNKEDRIN